MLNNLSLDLLLQYLAVALILIVCLYIVIKKIIRARQCSSKTSCDGCSLYNSCSKQFPSKRKQISQNHKM